MGSMFRQIMTQKEEKETTITLPNIVRANDDRYYICTENGRMIAFGMIDDIYETLPGEYKTRKINYWFYDPAREIVKIVF